MDKLLIALSSGFTLGVAVISWQAYVIVALSFYIMTIIDMWNEVELPGLLAWFLVVAVSPPLVMFAFFLDKEIVTSALRNEDNG